MSSKRKASPNSKGQAKKAKTEAKCPFIDFKPDMTPGEGPAKCTWFPGTKEKSPHIHRPSKPEPKILDTILDHIGNTPLVRLNKIPQSLGVTCEVLAKCEFFNAGGSVKDRIGRRMVEDAEQAGRIKLGDTLIEPTSGNTGIGLALAAAVKGYKMVITLPEKMSQEKVDVLKGLGAEIHRTPTEAAWDSPESHIGVAKALNASIPNSHILDQYGNPSNPLAHYDQTAEEILYSCDGKLDALVISAGTGGTISGIAAKIKERLPNCKIIGVDPVGSILALPNSLNENGPSYKVEGIGYDFIPNVLNRKLIDGWIKTTDKPSFLMSRRLIREEGLLCGGSCGSAVYAAMEYCKTHLTKGQRCVVMLPDSTRNYMTKFLNDQWMIDNNYMPAPPKEEKWWSNRSVADLKLSPPVTVAGDVSCQTATEILASTGYDQIPVLDTNNGEMIGLITSENITSKIVSGRVKGSDPVSKVTYREFKKVEGSTTLQELSSLFEKNHFVVVMSKQISYVSASETVQKTIVSGVASRIDLLRFILQGQKSA